MDPGGRGARSQSGQSVLDRLADKQLVIVSGKGGVGRTTMATVIGLGLAARGRRTLIATTGHDDRLAWMLGQPTLTDVARPVGDNLSIQRLVPQTCLREYGTMVLRSARIATAVFDNKIIRRLLHAIPGMDDFAVVGKAWHEASRGSDFDVVIFDGPATGHLMYTLGLPQAILDTIAAGPLTKEAALMQATLSDSSKTEAVLVGLPERWPLTELAELGDTLGHRMGIALHTIVVNGIWPAPSTKFADDGSNPALGETLRHLAELEAVGESHRAELASFVASDKAKALGLSEMLAVPWRWKGIADRAAIEALWTMLDRDEAAVLADAS